MLDMPEAVLIWLGFGYIYIYFDDNCRYTEDVDNLVLIKTKETLPKFLRILEINGV
jgi:hypothetical protein